MKIWGPRLKANIDSWLSQKQSVPVWEGGTARSWKLSYIFCLGTGLAASRLWVWGFLVSFLWFLDLVRVILLILLILHTSNTLFRRLDLRPTAKCVCTLTKTMALYLKYNLRPPEQQACLCTVRLARLWGRDQNHFTHWRGRVGYLSHA